MRNIHLHARSRQIVNQTSIKTCYNRTSKYQLYVLFCDVNSLLSLCMFLPTDIESVWSDVLNSRCGSSRASLPQSVEEDQALHSLRKLRTTWYFNLDGFWKEIEYMELSTVAGRSSLPGSHNTKHITCSSWHTDKNCILRKVTLLLLL